MSRIFALGVGTVVLVGVLLAVSSPALASLPSPPTIREPSADNLVLNPADVHMEAVGFADLDGDTHACSDWEIWTVSPSEPAWQAACASGAEKVHVHLGDGEFINSHTGRTELDFDTDYRLRVRFRDSADEASPWSERPFTTSAQGPPGNPAVPWTVRQPGFEVENVASGFQLPVNVAAVPEPGDQPGDPFLYVAELYGTIKVVTRNGAVSDYATDLLNFDPTGPFPGSGEQGLTGIVVDPASGDVFASMVYEHTGSTASPKPHYAKVVRFHSNDGGRSAAGEATILDMPGEPQGASHQVSNLTFGPDGTLYVHNGDGTFDVGAAQDLDSFLGKVLRMNLDGSAPSDNPFYDAADGISARDYVFAYGFRNPFGGAWRAADGAHYEVENGPKVDRLAKVVAGRNYLWDGSDASMTNLALYNWSPPHSPVNIAFVEPQTAFGSGFPADKMDHAFVTESGPTYATGPQEWGKRIVEFVPDETGESVSAPLPLVEYTGVGKASAAGLVAATDGLYFTDLYKDVDYSSPSDRGANLLRVRYAGPPLPWPQGSPPPVEHGPGALALDLKAKKQRLKRKLKFFATANVASRLKTKGRKVKKRTKQLAANRRTKVKVKLKRKARKRLVERLERKGKAKVKIKATARTQSGAEDTARVRIKLKG